MRRRRFCARYPRRLRMRAGGARRATSAFGLAMARLTSTIVLVTSRFSRFATLGRSPGRTATPLRAARQSARFGFNISWSAPFMRQCVNAERDGQAGALAALARRRALAAGTTPRRGRGGKGRGGGRGKRGVLEEGGATERRRPLGGALRDLQPREAQPRSSAALAANASAAADVPIAAASLPAEGAAAPPGNAFLQSIEEVCGNMSSD